MQNRKSSALYRRRAHSNVSVNAAESNSPKRMRSAVGEVVYAVRMPDGLIKIGWTGDFGRRKERLGAAAEVLSLQPGTRADEATIHAQLRAHRAMRHEYYHPAAEVLAVVNEMRATLSLAPLES